MAKQEIRTVNGKQYLYYTHYEMGGRTVTYCGPADSIDSQLKGAKLELQQTVTSLKILQNRQRELKDSIAKLRTSKAGGKQTARVGGRRKKSAAATTAAAGKPGRARKKGKSTKSRK